MRINPQRKCSQANCALWRFHIHSQAFSSSCVFYKQCQGLSQSAILTVNAALWAIQPGTKDSCRKKWNLHKALWEGLPLTLYWTILHHDLCPLQCPTSESKVINAYQHNSLGFWAHPERELHFLEILCYICRGFKNQNWLGLWLSR